MVLIAHEQLALLCALGYHMNVGSPVSKYLRVTLRNIRWKPLRPVWLTLPSRLLN